jgi:uncharacterized protein YneF (UPF0154 family)
MSKTTAILSGIIFVLLIAAVGYFVFQNQKLTNQLEKNPQTQSTSSNSITQAATQTPTPLPSPTPKALTIDDIHQIITTNSNLKDHSALLPYLKGDSVNFIVMSSGCCAPKTAKEAIDSLNYIDEGIPFDFDQNNTTIKDVRGKNERLTKAFIGISKNSEKLVAFTLDTKNQITQIEVSASWKLY